MARFVERFGAMLEEGGVPRMPARVFSALLATDSGRLTAAELAEQLKISPAAVSGAVRYLIQVRLVTASANPVRGATSTPCTATSGTRRSSAANRC